MRKLRFRKPVSFDLDHMRILHHEAIEQLELMRTAIEAAEQASDRLRDNLDDMAFNHWHAYMDIMQMCKLQYRKHVKSSYMIKATSHSDGWLLNFLKLCHTNG